MLSPYILQPVGKIGVENMIGMGEWAKFLEAESQWSRGGMFPCEQMPWWIVDQISPSGKTQEDEARAQPGKVTHSPSTRKSMGAPRYSCAKETVEYGGLPFKKHTVLLD